MRAVAETCRRYDSRARRFAMSVGVAIYPEDGLDAEALLAEADRRMYKGKRMRKKSATSPALEPTLSPRRF